MHTVCTHTEEGSAFLSLSAISICPKDSCYLACFVVFWSLSKLSCFLEPCTFFQRYIKHLKKCPRVFWQHPEPLQRLKRFRPESGSLMYYYCILLHDWFETPVQHSARCLSLCVSRMGVGCLLSCHRWLPPQITSPGSALRVKLLQIVQTDMGFTIKPFRSTLPCKSSPILHTEMFHNTCRIFNWFHIIRFLHKIWEI